MHGETVNIYIYIYIYIGVYSPWWWRVAAETCSRN